MGTGIMTVTLSALIAKFLSPPKDAIVFSRYAYYCYEPQKFLVIYLNTTRNRIVNADQSSYFKLAGNWTVTPSDRSPLITRAVQTFHVARVPKKVLVARLDIDRPDETRDLLRFGISGQLGGSSFSAGIEYNANDILVIPNRDELTAFPGFWQPNLKDEKFLRMFHYRPDNAPTLVEYVRAQRQLQNSIGEE